MKFSRQHFSRAVDVILVLIVAFVLYQRVPTYFQNLKSEDKRAALFQVPLLSGGVFDLAQLKEKKIVVFWATWCGACKSELERFNNMIQNNELKKEHILAISVSEEAAVVQKTVKERQYLFDIALDVNGEVSNLYHVSGLPTLVLIDQNQIVQWMTTGISPMLDHRIKSFIK